MDAIAAVTTRYYYDGQRVVLQTVVSGLTETDSRTFLYGSYIDEVLLMTALDASPQTDYYYAHDHLYSPVALFLSNGTLAERYEYDAYGKTRIRSSNYLPQTSSQYGNSYTFTGRELDSLNNNSLQIMYYRARSYDPQSGRFMQRDPAEYNDSMNIYEYVISRPTMLKDPYGLFWKLSGECPFMVGGIKVRCAKLAGEVIDENSGWMSPDTLHQYLLSLGLDVVGMPLGGTATKVGWGIAIGWTFANNCCIPEMKVEAKKVPWQEWKGRYIMDYGFWGGEGKWSAVDFQGLGPVEYKAGNVKIHLRYKCPAFNIYIGYDDYTSYYGDVTDDEYEDWPTQSFNVEAFN